ncbi:MULTISPECIES: carboxypeptidase regulatory-like domain-containing protein [unclassified Microbacterium]|uniref:carboxypeptidase regulatory-like domain-containing protein n=1 Tax=unclassified Microbacterium TaxID=2609290 RepID=UPI00214C8EBB|nr:MULTISPECIES: carboxypeptidase regulatory-like domain-containing protein [unclassified Microbacterium]MCR2785921.1 carboxypeptidase regulatory-like domain-containing protein [Microbacterium sp. zg.B96]WIM17104.1 carboxypeptidase regulatory-like domain-containing protein [Microbacterium sp. zg-B96]
MDDDGFTLIEVIVAMLIFTIILTGFLYTMTASLTATRDTRARIVAANLASQQIDVLRSAADAFGVTTAPPFDIELNGDTFHVRVETEWVTTTGAAASCEAGLPIASLAYNHVTVKVTWDNMREGAQPVYSDTSLTPRTKINDPALGTVLVGVVNAAGTAVAGATVSLTPAGVAAVTTGSDGCAYLLKVPPGDYTVTVSKAGHVSEQQIAEPTATVPVTAGGSSRVSFAYDRATSYIVSYGSGLPAGVRIPNNLTTTFVSTYGNFQMAAITNARTKTFSLYPVSAGYSIMAGAYAETPENPATSCLTPDPGEWIPEPSKVGTRPGAVGGEAGSAVPAAVPMGEVRLDGANGAGTSSAPRNHLKAVYVGGGAGDPGCPAGMTYTFGDVISSNKATILLPYGTWKLYRGNASSQTTQITTGIIVPSSGSVAPGVVVLDPRVAP